MTLKTSGSYSDEASNWQWLLAALSTLLMIRVFFLFLSPTNLYFDEAQYWYWSQHPEMGFFSKPPLIAWLIGATTSVCGSSSEFCVRIGSPIVHTATAIVVYLIGRHLYDQRVGFWSALGFATLPAVSLSSNLISTDVPLLFFWASALYCWIKLLETRTWRWAVLLGIAFGLGLMSKYAMIYFVLCAGIFLATDNDTRWLLRNPRLYLALAIGALILSPNIIWNIDNGFITFTHTADNAKWDGALFNWRTGGEFFVSQFAVFGPVLFGVFIFLVYSMRRIIAQPSDRLLLIFSLPILTLILLQAFLSRAHANWAAASYVAATILVVSFLLRQPTHRWLSASMIIHGSFVLLAGIGFSIAGNIQMPIGKNPSSRLLGWDLVADETRKKVMETSAQAVTTIEREYTAELIYYLRDTSIPVFEWKPRTFPQTHYQMKVPLTSQTPEPIIYVTPDKNADRLSTLYADIRHVGAVSIPAGKYESRVVNFFLLSGYRAAGSDDTQ